MGRYWDPITAGDADWSGIGVFAILGLIIVIMLLKEFYLYAKMRPKFFLISSLFFVIIAVSSYPSAWIAGLAYVPLAISGIIFAYSSE